MNADKMNWIAFWFAWLSFGITSTLRTGIRTLHRGTRASPRCAPLQLVAIRRRHRSRRRRQERRSGVHRSKTVVELPPTPMLDEEGNSGRIPMAS